MTFDMFAVQKSASLAFERSDFWRSESEVVSKCDNNLTKLPFPSPPFSHCHFVRVAVVVELAAQQGAEFLTLKDIVLETDAQLVDSDCKLHTVSNPGILYRIQHVVPEQVFKKVTSNFSYRFRESILKG